MNFSELQKINKGELLRLHEDRKITYLLTDSRKVFASDEALFFAIAGERHDGHQFIKSLYQTGIRQFVIEKPIDIALFPEANFFLTPSSVDVLQYVVKSHRRQFAIPVIGITGSNGKTIIKEWLYQLLSPDYSTVKNPGSYNSQIGVPLSVWQMQSYHQLGIFEGGISQPGEMEKLESIIQPTVGLFTNIGSAHDQGFENATEKIQEKLKLFKNAETIIYCKDQIDLSREIENEYAGRNLVSWGKNKSSRVHIHSDEGVSKITWEGKNYSFTLPFRDSASIENIHHCIVLLFCLGIAAEVIQERIPCQGVSMRMEMKQGVEIAARSLMTLTIMTWVACRLASIF